MAPLAQPVSPIALKPQDPRPWYQAPGAGATNHTRHEIARRARQILEGDDYQRSLQERIHDKTLAPAVETMLWHYAYGKPMESVELTVRQGDEDFSTLTEDALEDRLKRVHEKLAHARAIRNAIPAEVLQGPWPQPTKP